ncbi:MAG: LamG domain-containing protein, partial [Planctomycetota bacterium]
MFKKLIYLVCFVFVVGVALTSQVDAALPGLVGWWKFDDGSGTTAKDSSRNGHDGTLNGDPQWVAGQLGGALDFDGAGDFVEVPHNPSLSITNEITIAAWTNMRGNASGEMAIVSKGGWSANDLPYELTETPGSIIYWQFYDDGGRDNCAPPSPPVDEWHHIAATYDGTIFKCYIDGQLAQEWGYVGKMPENTASVTIGRRSRGGTSFNGMIDEVAIFNRALGAEEIPN